MFLREYIYVDSEKVNGLAGQLYDGVPERATNIAAKRKDFGLDAKFANWKTGKEDQETRERDLSGSLFKDLEADLESLGLLRDLSQELITESNWAEDYIRPGKIIRLSAPGTLFHPAQLSDAIVGISTAAVGLEELTSGDDTAGAATVPPKAKTAAQKQAQKASRRDVPEPKFPEDYLPDRDVLPLIELPRTLFSGLIRVTRGVFGEGIHLHLRPSGVDGPAVTARLESGRNFLSSSPEVLFSRYGLTDQEWTVVGIVGQLGLAPDDNNDLDITNEDGSVNRPKFVDLVSNFLSTTSGLIDLPQQPGFSVVPIALYRTIGESLEAEQQTDA